MPDRTSIDLLRAVASLQRQRGVPSTEPRDQGRLPRARCPGRSYPDQTVPVWPTSAQNDSRRVTTCPSQTDDGGRSTDRTAATYSVLRGESGAELVSCRPPLSGWRRHRRRRRCTWRAGRGNDGRVVAPGGAWVGVASGLVNIAQRDTGVGRGSDDRLEEGVRSDRLVDPGSPGNAAHDSGRGVPLEALAVAAEEDRDWGALPDGEVDGPTHARCGGHGDDLAALAAHGKGAVPTLEAQGVDIGPSADPDRPFGGGPRHNRLGRYRSISAQMAAWSDAACTSAVRVE
jgi:hypothetical protein